LNHPSPPSTHPLSILLVEDSPTARFHAQVCLKNGLQGEYTLHQADCLSLAVEILAGTPVDVILLDLNLPESRGLDTFATITNLSGAAAIVIISGDTDENTAVRAARLGAEDYIVKGAGFTAEMLGRTVRFAIERNARRLLERELASVRYDLEIADTIQQRLYPRSDSQFAHVTLAGRCAPVTQNGGDYYDYILRPDGSLLVVIGDVSGHGIGSAMMMIETRAFIRALARSTWRLGEILTQVNRLIADDMQQQLFVTLFVAQFDPSGTRMRYGSAGHPGYLLSPNGHVIKLQTDNPPLGITPDETFHCVEVDTFEPGDLLALFTDGISEATRDHLVFLGERRVIQEIVSHRDQEPPRILESLFALAAEFIGHAVQQDDQTAVIVKTGAACR